MKLTTGKPNKPAHQRAGNGEMPTAPNAMIRGNANGVQSHETQNAEKAGLNNNKATQPTNLTYMAKIQGAITVNIERCKGCNLCVVACPTDTLSLQPNEVNDRGYHFAYMAHPEKCIGCSSCALVCPDACIEVYRVKVD